MKLRRITYYVWWKYFVCLILIYSLWQVQKILSQQPFPKLQYHHCSRLCLERIWKLVNTRTFIYFVDDWKYAKLQSYMTISELNYFSKWEIQVKSSDACYKLWMRIKGLSTYIYINPVMQANLVLWVLSISVSIQLVDYKFIVTHPMSNWTAIKSWHKIH